LLTDLSAKDIDDLRARVSTGAVHPKHAKVDLARRIVSDFHSAADADQAAAAFDAKFSRGELAGDVPTIEVAWTEPTMGLPKVLVAAGLATSTSDATRKVQQGAVKIDREKVMDIKFRLDAKRPEIVLEVGRRAVRIRPKTV